MRERRFEILTFARMRNSIRFRRIIPLFVFICMLCPTKPAEAQFTRGVQMNFGKNRVQYNDFLWTFYRFKSFDTYYYLGGQELAVYTGRTAETEIAELEKLFDYRINGRFQFIIYNRLSDLKQSNIGLEGEEQNTNTGGLTRIIGTKVLLYFDGDYRHFREQIRSGLTQVMIQQLMYGGSIKDRVQSSVLLHLPDWYLNGLILYASRGWNVDLDGAVRDAILSGRYKNLNSLSGEDASIAGASLWNYIVETYGAGAVSNLLYMTRVNRNIDQGFLYVLGVPLKDLGKNWSQYYTELAAADTVGRVIPTNTIQLRTRRSGSIVSQLSMSPDGRLAAYVTNESGKYRIWLYNTSTNKRKRISKGGYRSVRQDVDLSFPSLAWHPSGKYLASIRERKGKLWLDYHMADNKFKRESSKFFYFDKVLDFSFSSAGTEFVLSAVQKGQSDLFTFSPRTKTYTRLTDDRWDDLHPRYVLDDRYIAFSSTRTADSLKPTPLRQSADLERPASTDLFLLDVVNKSPKLIPLSQTAGINETYPLEIDDAHFGFLSDKNGIVNRYEARLDSTIAYIDTTIHYRYIVESKPMTDFSFNLLEQDVTRLSPRIGLLSKADKKYILQIINAAESGTEPSNPLRPTTLSRKLRSETGFAPSVKGSKVITTSSQDGVEKDSSFAKSDSTLESPRPRILFQSEFTEKPGARNQTTNKPSVPESNIIRINSSYGNDTLSVIERKTNTTTDSVAYQLPKQRNYEIAFGPSYVLTQLDNNLLNETYQTFTGGAVYFTPGLNALFKIGISDLLDDYRFVGGLRLSGNLNSNEYYVGFDNLRHRLDKQISFYRQAREEFTPFSFLKVHTHEAKYSVRWPFSDITSLRGMVAYRHDRVVALSTDAFNLVVPNQYTNRISMRTEYVYDNTLSTGLNLYNGTRFKLFAEGFRRLDGGFLGVLGADIRHYTKIYKQLIWANRFAGSTSFGDEKLIYYLGSTDNAFTPTDNFNTEIQIDRTQQYSFQALATNLRGFVQNIRNGNSFALINSEIRIPVFQVLVNKPIRSDFVRNFQIVGFGDIGTAWTGPSPYSRTNALFRKEYPGNPISITVTKDIEPIVGGYGFGFRSRVLGYFLRADWAWGVDDGAIQERIFYFSLGLDF